VKRAGAAVAALPRMRRAQSTLECSPSIRDKITILEPEALQEIAGGDDQYSSSLEGT
jgi:hypothetical protein